MGPDLFVVFGIVWLVGLAVWIWALVDCIQVADDSMYQSGNKLIWVLVIVFLALLGAILYLLIGRPKPGAPSSPARLPPPPAPGGGP
ncbi:MAG: PLDc N-terminal domain-containing protein [Planctomycetaceae bacterium]